MTLAKRIKQFIAENYSTRNETHIAYKCKLKRLSDYFGERDPATITLADLKEWRQALLNQKTKIVGHKAVDGQLSRFTIQTCLMAAKRFFRWMHEEGHTPDNAAAKLKGMRDRELKPQPRRTNPVIIKKLIDTALKNEAHWRRVRDVAIICVLYDTAGRVGGVVNATLTNLDLKAKTITTIEKGNQRRTLYLTAGTIKILKLWLKAREELHPLDDHLFISEKYRIGLTRTGIEHLLADLGRRGNIKGRCNPHSFRHEAACNLLTAGVSIEKVARILGHASPVTTLRFYAEALDGEVKSAHAKHSPMHKIKINNRLL